MSARAGAWGLGLLLLSGLAMPVAAGTLYRCEDGSGARTYSNSKIAGTRCTAIGQYSTPPRARVAAPKPTVAKPAAAKPTFDNVIARGSADPAPAGRAVAAGSDTAATATGTQQVVFRTAAGDADVPAAPAARGARVTRGAVYKFVKDGTSHYTNVRPRGTPSAKVLFSYIETCYACGVRAGVDFGTMALNARAFAADIAATAHEFGVDEALVRAVIHAESAFNPNAVSRAGAQGLMQLMPATASRFGVKDPFTAAENIRGGVKYLAWLLKRFDGNVTLTAAAYNAGEGAVDRYGGVPPYAETQRYVERVGVLVDRYRGSLAAR